MTKISQPTGTPTRKVTAVSVGAIIATILAAAGSATGVPWVLAMLAYPGFEAAMAGGLAVLFGYFVKESA